MDPPPGQSRSVEVEAGPTATAVVVIVEVVVIVAPRPAVFGRGAVRAVIVVTLVPAVGSVAPVPVIFVAEEPDEEAAEAVVLPVARTVGPMTSRAVEAVEEIVEHGVVLSAAPGMQKTLAAS
ncbi:MAG: hypothetical protein AVDCRST_MAG33-144 [uncultured Thermomicrobiales bacterium]|uniref:Uncharacterized protein n=1 Tax=uncultured Thermomicrobiales bacterium TaxID=1645740 RepID=A0A6J4UAE6_9BACT|nr:MAG: hypothetical protein AVDCRST_MAG33-144 [uncultured Thermomicrobiales bacterium]